jgi:hypothetical protein
MKNFRTTTGLCVSFRCRYRTTSYFDVFAPRGASREIGKHDDGRLTVGEWGDDVTEAERQAIADYEAEESRQYAEWRERNAHIFA